MSLDVMGMVHKGDMRNTECILCGECCSTCSSGVMRRRFGNLKQVADIEKEGKLGM